MKFNILYSFPFSQSQKNPFGSVIGYTFKQFVNLTNMQVVKP